MDVEVWNHRTVRAHKEVRGGEGSDAEWRGKERGGQSRCISLCHRTRELRGRVLSSKCALVSQKRCTYK